LGVVNRNGGLAQINFPVRCRGRIRIALQLKDRIDKKFGRVSRPNRISTEVAIGKVVLHLTEYRMIEYDENK
jgi:hypothetical protein